MATTENPFPRYLRTDFSFAEFPARSRVLDVGCGSGRHLLALQENHCEATGIEPDCAEASASRSAGFVVLDGKAESLPVPDGSADGVVCCIVVPYTDERRAVAEWARVLVPGGEVRASFIGLGYALRYFAQGRSLRERFYGARTILNTWFYRLTGRRMPRYLGDTLYQSERRLAKYYRAHGFELVSVARGRTFLGLPVLIYHHLRKLDPVGNRALLQSAEAR
jgi:SAM-dependent methyltransferase